MPVMRIPICFEEVANEREGHSAVGWAPKFLSIEGVLRKRRVDMFPLL